MLIANGKKYRRGPVRVRGGRPYWGGWGGDMSGFKLSCMNLVSFPIISMSLFYLFGPILTHFETFACPAIQERAGSATKCACGMLPRPQKSWNAIQFNTIQYPQYPPPHPIPPPTPCWGGGGHGVGWGGWGGVGWGYWGYCMVLYCIILYLNLFSWGLWGGRFVLCWKTNVPGILNMPKCQKVSKWVKMSKQIIKMMQNLFKLT